MGKVILIDGHSILNRAFFGIPPLTNTEGFHTNAIYGFLNIMLKIVDESNPDYLAVAFDVHAPTFRHKLYSEYKGTRKPMAPELKEQVPVMKEVLHAMNIPTIEHAGYEADDILGTLSRVYAEKGHEVDIISGDRDLLQLADEHVRIRIPKTYKTGNEVENYYPDDVKAKYGVTPHEFIDMKALMGDSSDNVPGVPGIGEKTASKIISVYHNIETAHEHASEIKPKKASENLTAYYEQAQFSKVLVTIKTDCDLDGYDPESARVGNLFNENSYTLFKKLELNNILKRFDRVPESAQAHKPVRFLKNEEEANAFLAEADEASEAGLYYFSEAGLEGLSAAVDGKEAVCMIAGENGFTQDSIRRFARRLIERANMTSFMDIKSQKSGLDIFPNDRVFDISIAAYLLNPLTNNYTYHSVAMDCLNMTLPSRSDLFKKSDLKKAREESPEDFALYLALQSAVPAAARRILSDRLEKAGMTLLYDTIEFPLIFVLSDMEKAGIRANRDELASYGTQLTGRIRELEQGIYECAGEEFNINSPIQLGHILFEKLHLPFARKTKKGYSTSADVLEKLRSYDPIINMVLEYRQLTKLKSTYADGLAGYIDPADSRIHSTFNQTITATGRISSTEPNLQNIPVRMELGRLIRKVFVPDEGNIFVNADYSQIELRILAHMAGDENLIEAYREEKDIHRITASKVFHVPLEEVTPQQRRNAKAVNFGIVYGISSFGLSQDLSISRKEADRYIKDYFNTYPAVKSFLDGLVASAREKGYSETLYGRRRPVPELASSNFMQRQFGERVAMNAPIQGTAADIIKIAMINVDRRLRKEKLHAKLILQIHDELLIEADEQEEEAVRKILKEEMENAAQLSVPLVVDMNSGHNWYELK